MADIDASILLEWVNSLDWVVDDGASGVEELGDGRLLLRVMHDASPDIFPSLEGCATPLHDLLSGLLDHFRARHGGRGEACARRLLEGSEARGGQARAGPAASAALLLQLVVVATLESWPAEQQRYERAFETLGEGCQEAIASVVKHFTQDDGAETSRSSGGGPWTPAAGSSSASPSRRRFDAERHGGPEFWAPLPRPPSGIPPDWMEVGLDAETRFRRLKDHWMAEQARWEEDREHWEEERQHLKRSLETERGKRQAAEEAERVARAKIRIADEATDRVKEESRAVLEARMQHEAANYQAQVQMLNDEIDDLNEKLGIERGKAARAERAQSQLETLKRKLEESQVWKRERDELQDRLDQQAVSGQAGAGAHLQDRLASMRRELEDAALQNEVLKGSLDQLQRDKDAAVDELGRRRSQLGRRHGSLSAGIEAASAAEDVGRRLAHEMEQKPGLGRSAEDDLLDRLLVEKGRATRAETTLQLRETEVTALQERLQSESAQLKELQRGAREGAGPAEDTERTRELQALLAQRDRELQVHRWRGRAESDSLAAQEALMSSCFHEIGLRYHRLRAQHEILQRRQPEGDRPGSPPADRTGGR